MKSYASCPLGRLVFTTVLTLILSQTGLTAWAACDYFKDVCASGCQYTSVQQAISEIPTPVSQGCDPSQLGPSDVYTVFIDGIVLTNSSITTDGKSYINFVGSGMGVSILRATSTWFQNVYQGSQPSDFFDLAGSTNITFRGVTIDARTQDPGNLFANGLNYAGLQVGDADRVLIDSAEIQGIVYGVWEDVNTSGHLIEIFNSKIRGVNAAVRLNNATWHIFSSELRAVTVGGESGDIVTTNGLQASGSVKTTVWGSHIHAENGVAGEDYAVAAVNGAMSAGGSLNIIGSTLHVKMTTDITYSPRFMTAYYFAPTYQGEATIIGSELLYETTTSLSTGRIGGIGYSQTATAAKLNLVGVTFRDAATGGAYRADIIGAPVLGSQNQPTIRTVGTRINSAKSATASALLAGIGGQFNTIGMQKGTALFPGSSSVVVTLPTAMPDTNYNITLSVNAPETIYVTARSTTTFTLASSNGSSAASVDWIVMR